MSSAHQNSSYQRMLVNT